MPTVTAPPMAFAWITAPWPIVTLVPTTHVNDHPFLDCGPVSYLDGPVIAPEDGPVADVALLPYPHVPDHECRLAHVGARADSGPPSIKLVEHETSLPLHPSDGFTFFVPANHRGGSRRLIS